jgi:hypothetical protein
LEEHIQHCKSGEFREELRQGGWATSVANDIVNSSVHQFESILAKMKKPSAKKISKALCASSREVKYVFGVLGFPVRTFVLLVNKYGLKEIDDILEMDNTILGIQDKGISETSLWKLKCFIEWYIDFLSNFDRWPEIIDIDFNEREWWGYYCYGREDENTEGRPMFRGDTDLITDQERHFQMYTQYVNFCELDLIRLAVYGRM